MFKHEILSSVFHASSRRLLTQYDFERHMLADAKSQKLLRSFLSDITIRVIIKSFKLTCIQVLLFVFLSQNIFSVFMHRLSSSAHMKTEASSALPSSTPTQTSVKAENLRLGCINPSPYSDLQCQLSAAVALLFRCFDQYG